MFRDPSAWLQAMKLNKLFNMKEIPNLFLTFFFFLAELIICSSSFSIAHVEFSFSSTSTPDLFLSSLSDVAEELRLPAASRRPHVRPAAGESHAVRRGRHAALLRHPCDGNTGRDDYRVSHYRVRHFAFAPVTRSLSLTPLA